MTLLGLDLPYLPAQQAARDQEYVAGERRRAGLRCAERALQETAEWDDAREDLRALLDMLGLKTGETR